MSHLTVADLHNPRKIVALFHLKRQVWIEAEPDQAFQEYPGSVELWQQMENGQLLRVQRWRKQSVLVSYPAISACQEAST